MFFELREATSLFTPARLRRFVISVTALGQIKSCREFFEDGAANAPLFSSSGVHRVAPVFASDVRIVAMGHVILLGDSIFDNAPYTRGGPAVASQVRKLVPPGWTVSLLAVDGSSTDDISGQMQRLPKDATHLILSVGGNNALTYASRLGISLFGMLGAFTSKALDSLADVSEDFERQYRSAVGECLRVNTAARYLHDLSWLLS